MLSLDNLKKYKFSDIHNSTKHLDKPEIHISNKLIENFFK